MDHVLLAGLNELVGHSAAAFDLALALCGQLPLAACVAVMLAWWWTDPGGDRVLAWPGHDVYQTGRDGIVESRCRVLALGIAVTLAFVCTRLIAAFGEGTRPLGHEPLLVPIERERWDGMVAGMTGFGAFPSDHAALYFALAVGLFWWTRWAGVLGTVCALVFSLARVAVGFHYPSDIAAGAALGASTSLLAMGVMPRYVQGLSAAAQLFDRFPRVMYPLLFVAALDFTQHFRMLAGVVFATVYRLVGMASS
jgi:undecaprenyl-diphosphatase